MSTDVHVHFTKVGKKVVPVHVAASRNGMYPDSKGKMPEPNDDNHLEGMIGHLLGVDMPGDDEGAEKALDEADLQKAVECVENLEKAHVGFAGLVSKLVAKGYSEEKAKAIAASIGRNKFGAKKMAAKAAAGKRKAEGKS